MPDATVTALDPVTVHTCRVLDVKDTCSCEVAVADKVTCAPACISGGCAKVIVCPSFTMNLRCAWAGA